MTLDLKIQETLKIIMAVVKIQLMEQITKRDK